MRKYYVLPNHHVGVGLRRYTEGEILPDLPQEQIDRLLKLQAVKAMPPSDEEYAATMADYAEQMAREESEDGNAGDDSDAESEDEDAVDDPDAESEDENATDDPDAESEGGNAVELPPIDATAGIVSEKKTTAKASSQKGAGSRKAGKA